MLGGGSGVWLPRTGPSKAPAAVVAVAARVGVAVTSAMAVAVMVVVLLLVRAGFVSTCTSTPADVIKTRLMDEAGAAAPKYRGMIHAFATILREEGQSPKPTLPPPRRRTSTHPPVRPLASVLPQSD